MFSNLKRLGLGVCHGFRRHHIRAYLDEFVFRWNWCRHYRCALEMLFGVGLKTAPMDGDVPAIVEKGRAALLALSR